MKDSWQYRLRSFMLPGLKRYIALIIAGIFVIVYGVLVMTGKHPVFYTIKAFTDALRDLTTDLNHRVSGIIAVSIGGLLVFVAILRMTGSILGAYLPNERESIPDVLYRRRHLDRGPKVVVIGGGHGLSNLLRGLKAFTHNITAIVTVGDDGGSSGRLREELGVLPPGDIRNCITALADQDKLVTELFQYRFEQGAGLEGHSFGNLFLSAVYAITSGDMIEATKAASRVLNSCGQVLPTTLSGMTLIAQLTDGRTIRGESQITAANGRIERLSCEPSQPQATPAALEAIASADLIVLGPGSLYTSIIPNLLVQGIPDAILDSPARKIYVCNVMTQKGETINYTVADHIDALLSHAGFARGQSSVPPNRFIEGVMVNVQAPPSEEKLPVAPVRYDPDRIRQLGIRPILKPLVGGDFVGHHDAHKLASSLMLWYFRQRPRRTRKQKQRLSEPALALLDTSDAQTPINTGTISREDGSSNAKEAIL
jgi:uncharacterized cofD-like protein